MRDPNSKVLHVPRKWRSKLQNGTVQMPGKTTSARKREKKNKKKRAKIHPKNAAHLSLEPFLPTPKLPGHFEAVLEADGHGLKSCQVSRQYLYSKSHHVSRLKWTLAFVHPPLKSGGTTCYHWSRCWGWFAMNKMFQYNFAHWPAPSVSRREVESRCLPGDSSQLEAQIRHIPHHSTSFTVVLIFIFISGMQRFRSRHIATILGHEPEQTWAVNSEVPWPATSVDSHGIAMG